MSAPIEPVSLADRRVDDWVDLSLCCDSDRAHAREMTPKKGSWEWAAWFNVPCPCCSQVDSKAMAAQGVTRLEGPSQTRWHVLTECPLSRAREGHGRDARDKAIAWLERNVLGEFSTQEAKWALQALKGAGRRLSSHQRVMALRFCLGLPTREQEDDMEAEQERSLAASYARGFLRPLLRVVREAVRLALNARGTWERSSLYTCLRWRMHDATRFGGGVAHVTRPRWFTRSAWMGRRSLHEVHEGGMWCLRCFQGWRRFVYASGPAAETIRLCSRGRALDAAQRSAALRACTGGVREEWIESSQVPGSNGDAVRALICWQIGGDFRAWALKSGVEREAWQAPGDRRVRAAAVVGLRIMAAAAVDARARSDERLAAGRRRGERTWNAMCKRLYDHSVRASKRKDPASGDGTRAKRLRAALDGERPHPDGSWQVERVLAVQQIQRGTPPYAALIRWAGVHDDEWRPWHKLCPAIQEQARRVARATLGVHIPHRAVGASGPSRICPRLNPTRFRRLRRCGERWHAATSLAVQVSLPAYRGVLGVSDASDTVRWCKRAVEDDLEDREIRGDGWRAIFEGTGRGVRQKTL